MDGNVVSIGGWLSIIVAQWWVVKGEISYKYIIIVGWPLAAATYWKRLNLYVRVLKICSSIFE
jgi:hypothetical protein